MTNTKEVLVIEKIDAAAVFVENGLNPLIDKIKAEVKGIVPILDTAKGRKEIASRARWVAKNKVFIDNAGKEYVAGLKAKIKPVDAERKRVREILDKLRDEVRQPLTEWEEIEEKKEAEEAQRIALIKEKIEKISQFEVRGSHGIPILLEIANSQEIEAGIEFFETCNLTEEIFQEFLEKAEKVHSDVMNTLKERLKYVKEKEALEVEKKKLKAEKEAIEQRERDKKIAEEAAKKAKETAERKALRAAEKLKEDKIKAELEIKRLEEEKKEKARQVELDLKLVEEKAEREKQAAIEEERRQVENARLEKEEAQKIKAANVEHRRVINRQIIKLFMECELTQEKSVEVLKTILSKGRELITVNY
jgi:hypothetical protein